MPTKNRVLFGTILAISLLATIGAHTISPARAVTGVPVFVLGVTSPTDPLVTDLQALTSSVTILDSVASLTTLNTNSILFIDGSWLASAASLNPLVMTTIIQTVVSGLPTIVVRGAPNILTDAISGLYKLENPGLPLIAEGTFVSGTLSDGTRTGALLRVISGFDYSVNAEFQWATQFLPTTTTTPLTLPLAKVSRLGGRLPSTITTSQPFWQLILTGSFDTGDQFQPFGRVVWTFPLYELQNSGSTNFKWFNVFSNQTTMPGIQIYGSNWRNYLETTGAQPNNNTNTFVSHGPGSLSNSGPFTVNYSIGTIAGTSNATVTANQSMSYFLKNTNVNDNSTSPGVNWIHTITGGTSAGKIPLQVIPGFTDKVQQPGQINLSGTSLITFATFSGSGTATNTQTTGVNFTIIGSG